MIKSKTSKVFLRGETRLRIEHFAADALSLLPIDKSGESDVDENIFVTYVHENDETRILLKSEDPNMEIEEIVESKVVQKEDSEEKICTIAAGKNEPCSTICSINYQREDRFCKRDS